MSWEALLLGWHLRMLKFYGNFSTYHLESPQAILVHVQKNFEEEMSLNF